MTANAHTGPAKARAIRHFNRTGTILPGHAGTIAAHLGGDTA